MKFKKIVAVDNIGFPNEEEYKKLNGFADKVELYYDYPKENAEIIKRIGDADCLLVSWNTKIGKEIIEACKGLKYIGMCCSLYDEKSANVDIVTARENGIQVLGVKDYGDQGVVEFITSELIELLHGFGESQWRSEPYEITGLKYGVIGLGVTGTMVANTIKMFGGKVCYFDMKRNPKAEEEGIEYLELDELLKASDIISTHLPKHVRILTKEKLALLGDGKIIINPSIGPTYELDAMKAWLGNKSNFLISEKSSMSEWLSELIGFENFIFTNITCGMTIQAKGRLAGKVMNNMTTFLSK